MFLSCIVIFLLNFLLISLGSGMFTTLLLLRMFHPYTQPSQCLLSSMALPSCSEFFKFSPFFQMYDKLLSEVEERRPVLLQYFVETLNEELIRIYEMHSFRLYIRLYN